MKKIIMLTGLPCSGKTTKALELCQTNKKMVRINPILLSEMTYQDRKKSLELAEVIAINYLESGYSVVIDDTNLDIKEQQIWKSIAESYQGRAKFEQIDLRPQLNFCVFHDAFKPEGSLGFDVINAIAMKYNMMEQPSKEFVLFDVDSMMRDKLDPTSENYLKDMRLNPLDEDGLSSINEMVASGYKIVFYSSLPKDMAGLVKDWLNTYGLLLGEKGFTPVTIFVGLSEKDIYKTYFKDKYQIYKVMSDRSKVEWNKLGIEVQWIKRNIK